MLFFEATFVIHFCIYRKILTIYEEETASFRYIFICN